MGYSLVEENTFRNMLKAPVKDETTGFKVEGEGHIVRFNMIDTVAGPATICVIRPPIIMSCQNNRIYNNTFRNAKVMWELRDQGAGAAFDNILKNNQLINTGMPKMQGTNKSVNNSTGDAFVDRGVPLTATTTDGDGTTVAVQDARWFTDGFGIVAGDRIRVGANPPATITATNYGANTLTFDKPLKWGKGDTVPLPYSGQSPDLGEGALAELTETVPNPSGKPAIPTGLGLMRTAR